MSVFLLACVLSVACSASAREVRVLALASDVASCETLARELEPFNIRMAVVRPDPATLEALATDGADLRSQYDVVFLQHGDVVSRLGTFEVVLCDALVAGSGLVVEGGSGALSASAAGGAHLSRYLPVVPLAPGFSETRSGAARKPTVQDEQSGLLRFLGWGAAPAIRCFDGVVAKAGAKVHLTVDGHPLLVTWSVESGRVVAFMGGLTGAWAEEWRAWASSEAFRARLFLFAAGTDERALKSIIVGNSMRKK